MAAAAESSDSQGLRESLQMQLRGHEVGIAELRGLQSSRFAYQKNGNIYVKTEVEKAKTQEQRNAANIVEEKRFEFFKRRCSSFRIKDLEKHYKRLAQLFFAIGGEDALKPVFLSSIPDPISNLVEKRLKQRNQALNSLTIGQIQQEIHLAVEELRQDINLIDRYFKGDKRLDQACTDKLKGLRIKCTAKDSPCSFRF